MEFLTQGGRDELPKHALGPNRPSEVSVSREGPGARL